MRVSESGHRVTLLFEPEWRTTLVTVLMLPVLIGLGLWQLQRAQEKAEIAMLWQQRQAQSPVEMVDLVDGLAAPEPYLPVRLAGHFLPEKYFLLDNRIHRGRFGYEVIGIFLLDDTRAAVLVNRGWIDADAARRSLPEVPEVAGPVVLTGHLYISPGMPLVLSDAPPERGWPKRVQMVKLSQLEPLVKQLVPIRLFPDVVRIDAMQPGALTAQWTIVNVSPEKHRAYAVQWFTMALALAVFYMLRSSNIWQWLRCRRAVK